MTERINFRIQTYLPGQLRFAVKCYVRCDRVNSAAVIDLDAVTPGGVTGRGTLRGHHLTQCV